MGAAVIGLAGYARSGKDSVAEVLLDAGYTLTSIGPLVVELAEELKLRTRLNPAQLTASQHKALRADALLDGSFWHVQIAYAVNALGYEAAKEIIEVRQGMQLLGSATKDKPGGGRYWIDWALDAVSGPAVVSGVRSLPEVEAIRARKGVVVWVSRPGYGPANDHINERQLGPEDCDIHLLNDGTLAQLKHKAAGLL